MRKLKGKLMLSFLGISLGVIILATLLINYFLEVKFQSYLEGRLQGENKKIVDIIRASYQQSGGWNFFPYWSMHIAMIAMMNNRRIRIENSGGEEILDTDLFCAGSGMMSGMMGPLGMMRGGGSSEPQGRTYRYPLSLNGQRVGEVYITFFGEEGLWEKQDRLFRQTVNFSILLTALISIALAMGVSLILSEKLTRPLKNLTLAARRIGEGDFSEQVKVESRDELGMLGYSFNLMAQRLNKLNSLRKNLTANLAHELRTPLTILRSYVEGLKDGVIPPTEENLSSMEEEITRLTKLTQAMEKVWVAEGKRISLNRERKDLVGLIKTLLKSQRLVLEERGLTLKEEYPSYPVFCRVDEESMKTIINNLLSNACKYTSSGGEVRVILNREENRAVIRIEDTGEGIDKQDLPFVFERFYRGKNRSPDGLGIGLTVVKELVEAQGGKVLLESEPGKGTRVLIFLPLD